MKLILQPADSSAAGTPLPAGVTLVEHLASGSMLVDATPFGEQALREAPEWSVVRQPGFVTVDPGGVDEASFVDVHAAFAASRARRAK